MTVSLLFGFSARGQVAPLIPGLGDELTAEDISQAAIAFVNFSSVPGVNGANFRIRESGRRNSDLIRSNLGFSAEFTIRGKIVNGFWGASLGAGHLEDTLQLKNDLGEPVQLDMDRQLLSVRGSGGLSFPITQHFKLRPYLSLVGARMDTETFLVTLDDTSPLTVISPGTTQDSYTVAGTLQAIYDRWMGPYRVELTGAYTDAYTDVFTADAENFETTGWNSTLVLTARWSGATRLETAGRPWRWNTFANYTNFLDQKKLSLGFRYYAEFGVGLDYEWNLKPLDWFGIRYVGLRAAVIVGDDVNGYSIGLSFQ